MPDTFEYPEMVTDSITLTPTAPPTSNPTVGPLRTILGRSIYKLCEAIGISDLGQTIPLSILTAKQLILSDRNVMMVGSALFSYGVTATNKLFWSGAIYLDPIAPSEASDSYIDLTMPSTALDSTGANRASGTGITLTPWESLWVTHTRGANSTTGISWSVAVEGSAFETALFATPNSYCIAKTVLGSIVNSVTLRGGGAVKHGTSFDLQNMTAISENAMKPDVRATTTANITLSGTQTVDTVALVAGDRVLVKNQTTTSQNGIYIVAAGAWARAADLDSPEDFANGVTMRVREGSTGNAGQFYYLSTTTVVVVGTTAIGFTVQPGAPAAVADASTTQKGAVLTSVTPAVAASPTVYGVNDTIFATFIDGLELTWDSATVLGVEPGAAWIQAAGRIVDIPTRLTLTVSSPGANTKNYVYLVYNTGTGAVTLEATTTTPVVYKGSARNNGATTRRYVGMVIGNAAGTGMYKWKWGRPNRVMWLESMTISPFRLGTAFGSTTVASVSAAGPVSPAARQIELFVIHLSTQNTFFSNSEANFTLSTTNYLAHILGSSGVDRTAHFLMTVDASQAFTYIFSASPSANSTFGVRGYVEER